jgi:protein-disulfide isomerase
VIFTGRKT